MRIVMLGAPGAGKGTCAAKISARYNIPHISTGDIFRANIKEGTDLGKKVKGFIDNGFLVPDSLTVALVMDRTGSEDCRRGYVLDGFPRTIAQADALKNELEKRGEKLNFAIEVDVPDEIIVSRMAGRRTCTVCGAVYHVDNAPPKAPGVCDECGGELVLRQDDTLKAVRERLLVYHEKTKPLTAYYDKEGILRRVDGTGGIDEVFGEAVKILEGADTR